MDEYKISALWQEMREMEHSLQQLVKHISALQIKNSNINDKNNSINKNIEELVNTLSTLQNQVRENLKYSENISEQNKAYYQDVQISLNHGFSNLNEKIAKTIKRIIEDLPLDKLDIEVLDKIESAFKRFQSLEKDLIRLKDELEFTQKYSRAILDDVENATIRFNRLNGEIDSKMNKINVFLGAVGGVVIAFLLQNFEFFLNIGTRIKTITTNSNWEGYLVIFTLVAVAVASIFSVWWVVYDTIKEKEEKRYIV